MDILRTCLHRVPHLVGQQIKYNKIDPDIRSPELNLALEKLTQAHLIQPVIASTGSGVPLDATENLKQFKLNFVDVGLVTRISRIDSQLVLENDVMITESRRSSGTVCRSGIISGYPCFATPFAAGGKAFISASLHDE